MPKNPDRPKIKYKKIRQPKVIPPKLTPDEKAARNVARLEAKLRITPAKVNAVIAKERGLLTGVCRSLKISRSTLTRYIAKHPECIEALDNAREAMGDKAEGKLFELIERGDLRSILYYLSTVHRRRGYGANGSSEDPRNTAGRATHIDTVNIIAVPSGTFLPKTPPPVIEHQ